MCLLFHDSLVEWADLGYSQSKGVTPMLYHAKNGTIPFPDSDMSYIRFGSGEKNLGSVWRTSKVCTVS